MSDRLLTIKEAADLLDIEEGQMQQIVDKGQIEAYHIGGMYIRLKEDEVLVMKDKDRAAAKRKGQGPLSNINDFLYFNDFYIITGIIMILLLYIIMRSIK